MTGKEWVGIFLESLFKCRDKANSSAYNKKYNKWTEFMVQDVIKGRMGRKTKCEVVCKLNGDSQLKGDSGEYLNIDAMFFNRSDYEKQVYLKVKQRNNYDPWVLPAVIVEHENGGTGIEKIAYCLWKLLCIRSQLRVLIIYGNGVNQIKKYKEYLQKAIKESGLDKGLMGELFIIIGNLKRDGVPWDSIEDIKIYFKIFEWKNTHLQESSVENVTV
jgi:hypothetical protein